MRTKQEQDAAIARAMRMFDSTHEVFAAIADWYAKNSEADGDGGDKVGERMIREAGDEMKAHEIRMGWWGEVEE